MAWTQLRRRGGRTLALALAIMVAALGFTVLTASARESRLATVGTVEAHAKTTYDVLVRPKGARSGLETSQGLVQPGFMTGIYGGITLAQWDQIKALSGVQVAAPVAMVGYVYPSLKVPVDVSKTWPTNGDSVTRVDVTWSGDNGLTHTSASPDFTYVTSRSLQFNTMSQVHDGPVDSAGTWTYVSADGRRHDLCNGEIPTDLRPESRPSILACFSRTKGGASSAADLPSNRGLKGVWLTYPLPYVVAAVDPASEDALVGLDSAVTSGKPLRGASLKYASSIDGNGVPILMGEQVPTNETATIKLTRLAPAAATAVVEHATGSMLRRYSTVGTSTTTTVTAQQAHTLLLDAFRTTKPLTQLKESRGLPGETTQLAQVDAPIVSGDNPFRVSLRPPGIPSPGSLLRGAQYRAPDSTELAARKVTTSFKWGDTPGVNGTRTTLYLQGTFDPAKLSGLSDLTAQILGGYATAPTVGADDRSRQLLGNQPLAPSSSLTGFVQPPPLMITALDALTQLQFGGWDPTTGFAPISAIRVKVVGVTGVDATSRERVRLVAQRIQAGTGLDVDVTVGSSPTAKALTLPPGNHGRPELSLSQWWLKKGVAVAILSAVDKKSLMLFFLVLLVSALSVANSTVASVRARRTELGVLAGVGWQRRHLFTVVVAELGIVAGGAGIVAGLGALALGAAVGTPVGLARASLALPAALAVAIVAGLVPAWMAARADPMAAVRPAVDEPRKASRLRSVAGMGRANITRSRARTLLAALGLLIGVGAFTTLLAITLGFQGAVVGTVLGDAVAVQARGADYAAVAATLALAGLGVANVMYLNIRDRGPELATLRAVGWEPGHLDRMIITEGVGIGLVGAIPGALLGVATAWALTGSLTTTVALAAAVALLLALALAAAAAVLSTRLVRRLPTTVLLTE